MKGAMILSYTPKPLDTGKVQLTKQLQELTELLAENAHDNWARQRMSEGWSLGPRDDDTKRNPNLIPYKDLPDLEKEYDRKMVLETLKAIVALGYSIEKKE